MNRRNQALVTIPTNNFDCWLDECFNKKFDSEAQKLNTSM